MSYVGIPFLDGGRTRDGVDCWGLVRLAYREEAGIDLPDHGEISAADLARVARQMVTEADVDPWLQIAPGYQRRLDVVLMTGLPDRARRAPIHVGFVVDARRLCHVEKGSATVVARLDDPLIRPRFIGFRRHRDLA